MSLDKLRELLSTELTELEARIKINREDFDTDHPAVFYLQEQVWFLHKLERELE